MACVEVAVEKRPEELLLFGPSAVAGALVI